MLYFSYCPHVGVEVHETAREAKDSAEYYIAMLRKSAKEEGGWDDCVRQTCWGTLNQVTVETENRPIRENDSWDNESGTVIDYGLVDVDKSELLFNEIITSGENFIFGKI